MSVFNPECTSNYFQVLDIDPSGRARREWEGAQE